LITAALLPEALLVCGCNSKPTQAAKTGVPVATSSGSDTGHSSGQSDKPQSRPTAELDEARLKTPEIASGESIAAGAKAAAKFPKLHQAHSDPTTWKTIQRSGMSVRYPSDWQLNPSVPDNGPIALNTFESHYSERGGHFPNHGAEIDISYVPKPSGSVQQVMNTDLKGSDDLKIDDSPIPVDDAKAIQASYSDSFRGYLAHETLAVYVEHGTGLYKFFLTYHKGEAWAPQFVSDFDEILKSVRFSQ
jgi:hypothetical protein